MMRVYDALKSRILSGGFRPGERLDPARLADQMSASATPVRDALHRLTGEGLVDNLMQDGFRQPQISETAMRDRYEWSAELLTIVARAAFRHGIARNDIQTHATDYSSAVTICFHRIAMLSPNHEHRHAVGALIDRSAFYRRAEADIIPTAQADLDRLMQATSIADHAAMRLAIDNFHRRRLRLVPQLAARLRDYPTAIVGQ